MEGSEFAGNGNAMKPVDDVESDILLYDMDESSGYFCMDKGCFSYNPMGASQVVGSGRDWVGSKDHVLMLGIDCLVKESG